MDVLFLWAAIIVVSLFAAAIIPVERFINNNTLARKFFVALLRTFIWVLIMLAITKLISSN